MLHSLDHVTVRSADFARTERFYCGLLGLRPGPRPAIALPGHWYYLGDVAVLHVLPPVAGQAGPGRSAIDHFALRADDLPAFEQRLRAAGQPFEGQRLADTRTWQVFLTDPDGARVEISFEGQAPPLPASEGSGTRQDGVPGCASQRPDRAPSGSTTREEP